MSSLKTTIKLESSTLFPTAINLTKVANEQIDGEYGAFQTNVLPAAGLEDIFSNTDLLGNSGVLYLYIEASTANRVGFGVDLVISNNTTGNSTYFARLLPGDVAYLPIFAADGNGITVSARNNDATEPATITYFFGSRD